MSLHLTIGILRVTYGHVVRRLLDRLEGVDLGAPLPVGFAAPAAPISSRRSSPPPPRGGGGDRAHDPARSARHEHRRPSRGVALARGRLQSIVAINRIEPSTIVVRTNSSVELLHGRGGRRLAAPRRPRGGDTGFARPALENLLSGEEMKVGELPGLDASRMVLVRRLVREGWLRIVHP